MSMPAEDWDQEVGRIYSATQFQEEVEVHFPEKERVKRARKRLGRTIVLLAVLVGALAVGLLWLRGVNMADQKQQSSLENANTKLRQQLGKQASATLELEKDVLFRSSVASSLGLTYSDKAVLRVDSDAARLSPAPATELYPERGDSLRE